MTDLDTATAAPDHVTRVEGEYPTGWRWICTCGTQSQLYGDTGAPTRAAGAHKRWKRAKEVQA